jgi:hypothetical protein
MAHDVVPPASLRAQRSNPEPPGGVDRIYEEAVITGLVAVIHDLPSF